MAARGSLLLPRIPVLLVLSLGLLTASTGCLFPPVEAPDDPSGPEASTTPTPTPVGTPPPGGRLVQRTASYEDAGEIGQAARIGDTATRTERHTHDLPARLVGLTLRFDWEPQAGEDLDVHLRIQRDGETVWSHDADGGRTGDPDDPVELVFDLDDAAYALAPSLLVLDVTAEATHSTLYDYTGTYSFEAEEPARR